MLADLNFQESPIISLDYAIPIPQILMESTPRLALRVSMSLSARM